MATSKPTATSQLAPGARITGEQRRAVAAELAARYAAGEAIRSMADDLGRSYGWVQGLLKEHGVELRGRGGATRGAAGEARARLTNPRRSTSRASIDEAIAPVKRQARAAVDAPTPRRRSGATPPAPVVTDPSAQHAKAVKPEKSVKADTSTRAEKRSKGDQATKAKKPSKAKKADKIEKLGRIEKPAKVEKVTKVDTSAKAEKVAKADKPVKDKLAKADKPVKDKLAKDQDVKDKPVKDQDVKDKPVKDKDAKDKAGKKKSGKGDSQKSKKKSAKKGA
ncbi:helix-turn-helix domain-containing protein [Luteococcus peritonei]|uniref:Helix-turn-helix domain-containing protein n=1 Tax=Luteococcus peritonei TaxID=88874 RepID=A0ABW4RSX7_9ACTN